MKTIGIVDTMFARYNMGQAALDVLEKQPGFNKEFQVHRATVPGFKDLAVAALQIIRHQGCDIVLCMGMPGGAELDRMCAHEASMGITMAQVKSEVPILEIFVHETEGQGDEDRLTDIFAHRCREHALNAWRMMFDPEALIRNAGMGKRQGGPDVGPLKPKLKHQT